MDGTAIILTNGLLTHPNGKTAHGLVRGTERYTVLGIVDGAATAGRDAGTLLFGQPAGIPVFTTLHDALTSLPARPDYAVIGVATSGGFLPETLHSSIIAALEAGISVVNGLHDCLATHPQYVAAAEASGARLVDIRRPKPFGELHFWTGDIYRVAVPRIAVLGADCAVGKRTTARLLRDACRAQGLATELIYTGQTGWLQGNAHGIILDALPNDFVSGELEHAVVQCAEERAPGLMLLEGQSSLLNPSGPCGAELLLSADARAVVLQLQPGRTIFKGCAEPPRYIADPADEIDLIARYGARVLAVTLNGTGMDDTSLAACREALEARLGLPVIRPMVEDELNRLSALARDYAAQYTPCA